MSLELARVRLRGAYAIVAGVLIFCLPVYEGFVLAPLGYITAVGSVSPKTGFGPLVQWTAAHPGPAFGFRLLQLIPFLLAFPLPRALRRVLPNPESRLSAVMAWSGQLGFACYALALLVGLFASNAAAGSANSSGAADAFANSYAVQTIISRIVGGVLISLCIVLASVGIARGKTLPDWLGFAGLLVAALLTATALQFAGGPAQIETPLSPWSFVLLAAWLLAVGVVLVRMRGLPATRAAAPATDAEAPASGASRGSTAESGSATGRR
jgi:hypothetical protein